MEHHLALAAVIVRPALKPGVVFREIPGVDESYVMVKEPDKGKYYKFDRWEADLLRLLDGKHSLEEIVDGFNALRPERWVNTQAVLDYCEHLRSADLLERSPQEKHLMLASRARTQRKRRLWNAEDATVTQIPIPLFDPNSAMDRSLPWIRWAWSPWFVLPCCVAFVVVLGFLVSHWDVYWQGFFQLVAPKDKGPLWLVGLLALLVVVSIWHELGHGFTCKRFGGEVHDIGFMIFYFQPAFYCNVDDAYLFPKRSHRIWASLGGPYFEMLMCIVAVAVWLTTPAEWWIHRVALATVFFTGIMAVAVNINPLIKLDGYYVIMDWLDVPNLREESFAFIGDFLKKHVLHLEVAPKPIPTRRRKIFWIYGTLSMVYTLSIYVTAIFFGFQYFEAWFGPTGYPLFIGVVVYVMRRRIAGLGRFVRQLWLDKKDVFGSWRRRLVLGVFVVLVLAALTVPRTATRVNAGFTVEPARRAAVRAPAGGFLTGVRVVEGARVAEGEILAVLDNVDLEASEATAAAAAETARVEGLRARESGDLAGFGEWTAMRDGAGVRHAVLAAKRERLALRAPIRGIVTTRDLESAEGRFVAEGEPFCVVDDLSTVKLDIAALESEVLEIRPGNRIRLLARSLPTTTLRAEVLSVSSRAEPQSSSGDVAVDLVRPVQRVRVLVEIANPDGALRPGMTGTAQFLTAPRSAVGKFAWHARRWFGQLVW